MRNPVQEYALARSLPIPELEKIMQGQSDTVSMTAAHAALKEKIEAEVAKKGAAAAVQAQAPKVRDKDLEMARGLTSLPVDIPMTPGGITGMPTVMAAGGGHVQRFQAGGQSFTSRRPLTAALNPEYAAPPPTEEELRKYQELKNMGLLDATAATYGPLIKKVEDFFMRGVGPQGSTYRQDLAAPQAMTGSQNASYVGPDIAKAEAAVNAQRRQIEAGQGPNAQMGLEALKGSPQSGMVPGLQQSTLERLTGQKPPAVPQISVPSGSAGLRSLMPKELTAEQAMEKARPFSSMETVAQYGAQRIEDLAKRQAEEKTAFEKTLIDNKDLFAEARQDLEKGALSSAKEKELDIAAALLKSAATVRKQDLLSGLASLGVDISGAEKTFNKAERERKAALMNIKRAERAEEAGNERAKLDFTIRANDQMGRAQDEFIKATMSVAEVDRKTALGMMQQVEERRFGIGMEIAKLDAAAGRLAAELKLRLDESGQKKSQQQITDALELAQRDYKNLDAAAKMKVDEEQYLRQRAANYLGILKSGTFGEAPSGQKVIDFTKIGR